MTPPAAGELATVIAEVKSAKLSSFRRRNLGLFEAQFADSSRTTLTGKWFHGAYLADRLKPGIHSQDSGSHNQRRFHMVARTP